MAETEETLQAEASGDCKTYYLQVWNEALNQVGVDASSTLRRAENVYYPPAIWALGRSSSKVETALKDLAFSKDAFASALQPPTSPTKEVKQVSAAEKEKEATQEVALESTKLPSSLKESTKEKGASRSQELVLVTLPFTTKEDPKGKGTT